MKAPRFSKAVHFLPWIGERYWDKSAWGGRVLILGESHYGADDSNRLLTREVIERQWNGESYSYFTKLAQAFEGRPHWQIDKRSFWSSVAFYNYVQEIVSDSARVAPTKEMWNEACTVLPEVIGRLRPDYIVATGSRLWDHLPDWPYVKNHKLKFERRAWQVCHEPGRKGDTSFATYIKHPSSPAYGRSEPWHKLLRAFLKL